MNIDLITAKTVIVLGSVCTVAAVPALSKSEFSFDILKTLVHRVFLPICHEDEEPD